MQNIKIKTLYSLEVRNLMERIIQYVKDRVFDNYIPCMKDKCDGEHVLMLIINNIHTKQTWINRKIKAKNS
ncbi:MAG: hypothetical protein QW803_03310 [Candidatus Methanomethylicia archaeon]